MKAYTNIPQSKKLAEILPIESADMFYNEEPDETYPKDIVDTKYPMVIREEQKHYLEEYGIPCWSLTALLSVLEHPRCFQGDKPTYCFCGCFGKDKLYHEVEADNFVDACYEMILKLHEQKLL